MTLNSFNSSVSSKLLAKRGIWALITSKTSAKSLTPKHYSTFSMKEITTDLFIFWLAAPPHTDSRTYFKAFSRTYGSPHFLTQSGEEISTSTV